MYAYLAKKYPEKVNKKVHAEFQAAKSLQGKVIGEYAKTDALCNQAMEIFVEYVTGCLSYMSLSLDLVWVCSHTSCYCPCLQQRVRP